MERRPRGLSLPHLRDLLARRPDRYEGMDLEPCRRVGGVCWLFGGVVALLLMLVPPPTKAIGNAGWYVALATNAISYVRAYVLRRPGSRIGFDGLLVGSYVAVGRRLLPWGGDEFAILLVDSGIEAAQEVGPRVQAAVDEHCALEDGSPLELQPGQSADRLVAAADDALLEAKRALVL